VWKRCLGMMRGCIHRSPRPRGQFSQTQLGRRSPTLGFGSGFALVESSVRLLRSGFTIPRSRLRREETHATGRPFSKIAKWVSRPQLTKFRNFEILMSAPLDLSGVALRSGKDAIDDWYRCRSNNVQTAFDVTIEYLAQRPRRMRRIGEIRSKRIKNSSGYLDFLVHSLQSSLC
jgi:hypothetical protein